jgi:uncharacterized protein
MKSTEEIGVTVAPVEVAVRPGARNGTVPHSIRRHDPRRAPALRYVPMARVRIRRRRSIEPHRLYYNNAWLVSSLLGLLLGVFGLRRFGRRLAVAVGVVVAPLWSYAAFREPARPRLERVELRLPQLPAELDGLRVGLISDLHLGFRFAEENTRWAVEQMHREAPEVVALTGDFISFHHAIPEIAPLLRDLNAPLGVYAVPGNHDYWEGIADVRNALTLCGIPLLFNQHRRLEWRGGELWLVGLDDIWDGSVSARRALEGVPPGAFTLLLAHSPDLAADAARFGFDVQLSGHTHGGQIRLPLLGPLGMPRFGRRYIMGRYQVGPTAVYVSRGIAGPPLRFLCPPEATIITLRRAAL